MSTPKVLNCNGKLISLDTPAVMGIVNITPDSFYEGSRFRDTDAIKRRAEEIVAQGGGIIDVGGFSTRPGASDVSEQEECDRVCMAVDRTCRTSGRRTHSRRMPACCCSRQANVR